MNNKMKLAAITVISVAVISAALGLFFLFQPKMQQETLNKQTDILLESIEQGTGTITLDQSIQTEVVDFYEEPETNDLVYIEPENGHVPAVTAEAPKGEVSGLGVLKIDKIDLKMPVAYGAGNEQLKVAAGWMPQTAEIGDFGNAVIAGHRNYSHGSHFNRLGEMAVGDSIHYTSSSGNAMSFIVTDILEVLPGDSLAFEQPSDVQMLTLYTCTPIRTATHRLLVRALRVS